MNRPARVIAVITDARGLSGYQTPAERRDAEEIMAVALAQPHRRPIFDVAGRMVADSRSERLVSVFGRFCANHKPRPLGDHCYEAGLRYGEIVREYKNAMGFDTPGGGSGEFGYLAMTDEQIQARKDLAVKRKSESDEVLRGIMPRLPRAMERLCYDDFAPSPYDEALIVDGLVLLAKKYGLAPISIRG